MEIAIHLGVHLTDEDRLLRCLMRNRSELAEQGIAVPGPGVYRRQLLELAKQLRDQPTDADTQEALLDGILEADDVRRMVLSCEQFLSGHRWIVADDRLYPEAGRSVADLHHLFPEARVQLYFAIRNPASFLPALAADKRAGGVTTALKRIDPASVRWSEMLGRLRTEVPDVPITVWCEEDTAYLWPEILRAVSGHDRALELDGWFAWYWDLMTPKTHDAMRRYFSLNKITDDLHRRRVLRAMMDKFARTHSPDPAPTLPGWSEDYVEVLTEIYDQDLDLISTMDGVTLLEP